MPKKDPYYTYTDYWPCKPAHRRIPWALIVAAALALAGAVYFGAALLETIGGL